MHDISIVCMVLATLAVFASGANWVEAHKPPRFRQRQDVNDAAVGFALVAVALLAIGWGFW